MVDALRNAWKVLRPRGHLVDVRPVAAYQPSIAIRRGRKRLAVGPIKRDPDLDVMAASRASQQVQREGLFTKTHAETVRWTASHPDLGDVESTLADSESWHLPAATRRRIVRIWLPGDRIEIGRRLTLTVLRRRER
jgi:hypothetical protein